MLALEPFGDAVRCRDESDQVLVVRLETLNLEPAGLDARLECSLVSRELFRLIPRFERREGAEIEQRVAGVVLHLLYYNWGRPCFILKASSF